MNKKDIKTNFKRASSAVKYGTLGALGGTLATAIIIPIMGLAAHGIKYFGDEDLDGYSLKNRFETAYCFDTPEKNKYYYSTPIEYGYALDYDTTREYYLASPYATYGAMALGGLTGAIALGGAGVVLAKRRENER